MVGALEYGCQPRRNANNLTTQYRVELVVAILALMNQGPDNMNPVIAGQDIVVHRNLLQAAFVALSAPPYKAYCSGRSQGAGHERIHA